MKHAGPESGTSSRDRDMARAGHARSATGFTLVEVLIAISVAAVLGLALISLVVKQGRFYTRNRDAVYAQQSLRSAVDLLATELRMASATDILAAGSDSVVLRSDVSRAVVCDSLAPDEVALFVYDSVRAANLPSRFRGTAISEPYASQVCYVWLIEHLRKYGYTLFDVQFTNPHIEQFGVVEIPIDTYLGLLEKAVLLEVDWNSGV